MIQEKQGADTVSSLRDTLHNKIPQHIGIIMDGNNRWAKQRDLPSIEGHRAGARQLRRIVESALKFGVPVLTVFAFSSENWRRPKQEVAGLMELFLHSLDNEMSELHQHGIRLEFIGDLTAFSTELNNRMRSAVELTHENRRLTLVVAVNYGGRWDIAQAARRLSHSFVDDSGTSIPVEKLDAIDEQSLHRFTCLAEFPELDLCIRTGYERRVSNFLLWQLAYAELYFADCLWPDFDDTVFFQALSHYANCERRFGMTSEQVSI